jgi:acetyl-CoA acetyltransferase family protein
MTTTERVAVIGGARTPFAKAGTHLKDRTALELGTHSVDGALAKLDLDPALVDQFAYGIVTLDARVPHLAREVNFASRLPDSVRSVTITAVLWSRNATRVLSDLQNAKTLQDRARILTHLRPGDFMPKSPGVTEPSTGLSMGEHTEITVKEWGISRTDQDEIAFHSHMNAAAATSDGRLVAEIHPLNGIDMDTIVRPGTSMEKLAKLSPVFDLTPEGTLTAGNSSPLTDGAASVVLMSESAAAQYGHEPLAFIKAIEFASISPDDGLLMGPGLAVPRMLRRAGMRLDEFDLIEMHEAFGGQVASNLAAWERGWKEDPIGTVDRDRLNQLGGSIAIGHPFAATGARIVAQLANEMARRDARYGLISICGAGATAAAVILERV